MYTKISELFIFRNNIHVMAYFKIELCRNNTNSKPTDKINTFPPEFRAYLATRIEETHKKITKKNSDACNIQTFFSVFVNNRRAMQLPP